MTTGTIIIALLVAILVVMLSSKTKRLDPRDTAIVTRPDDESWWRFLALRPRGRRE